MKAHLITLIFILFAGYVSAQSYDTYYDKGLDAYEKKEYEKAKEFFNLALGYCASSPNCNKESLGVLIQRCEEKIKQKEEEKLRAEEEERKKSVLAEEKKTISMPVKQAEKKEKKEEEQEEPTQKQEIVNPPPPEIKNPTYVHTEPTDITFDNKANTQDFRVFVDNFREGLYYRVTNDDINWLNVKIESSYFTVTCDANKGAYREHKLKVTVFDNNTLDLNTPVTIKQKEFVANNIGLSDSFFNVSKSGGTKTFTVSTDGYWWKCSTDSPSWIILSESEKFLTVKVSENYGNKRSGTIKVWSGDCSNCTKTITVNQSQKATYLTLEKNNLHFSYEGNSQTITIDTDGENWDYNNNLPYWLTAQKNGNSLTLKCNKSYECLNRKTKISIQSDNKNINPKEIKIKQSPKFNCPDCLDYPRLLGLSLGYVQKQWKIKSGNEIYKTDVWNKENSFVNGIQAGLRIEPLFKYGFGLSTGLFYEHYFSKNKDIGTGFYTDAPGTFEYRDAHTEHSLHLPLHLEYRANIDEYFQFFIEGGPSIDFGLAAKLTATELGKKEPFFSQTNIYQNMEEGLPFKRFNFSIDAGIGIRIGAIQLNAGTSFGMLNISSNPDINIKQNKLLTASLSWMIPYTYDNEYTDKISVNSIKKSEYSTWGITIGYISKQLELQTGTQIAIGDFWENDKIISGCKIGFVYQPSFGCGFGISTGAHFYGYHGKSGNNLFLYDEYEQQNYNCYASFWEVGANIPIHGEYRFHLNKDKSESTKNFSIFFESGPSYDIGFYSLLKLKNSDYGNNTIHTETNIYGKSDWGYHSNRFNIYWDFIIGIRYYNFQLSAGKSRSLTSAIFMDDFGDEWKIRQNRNLMINLTVFLNKW